MNVPLDLLGFILPTSSIDRPYRYLKKPLFLFVLGIFNFISSAAIYYKLITYNLLLTVDSKIASLAKTTWYSKTAELD